LGRILRFLLVNDQLLPAPGNPIVADSTWANGLRNTFAFTFDSQTGYLFATENGPGCGDEINLIVAGHNYGWSPLVTCDDPSVAREAGGQPPLISWTPTIAPTGIIIYDGEAFPRWQGQVFFCAFNQGAMYRIQLDDSRTSFVSDPVEIVNPDKQSSCYIELAQGPDDYIYYSSLTGIYRLVPNN
jgi:glucose/arabinose dehydrogenase